MAGNALSAGSTRKGPSTLRPAWPRPYVPSRDGGICFVGCFKEEKLSETCVFRLRGVDRLHDQMRA